MFLLTWCLNLARIGPKENGPLISSTHHTDTKYRSRYLPVIAGGLLWAVAAFGQEVPAPGPSWEHVRQRLQALATRAELVPGMVSAPSGTDRWAYHEASTAGLRLSQSQDPSTRARYLEWSALADNKTDLTGVVAGVADPDPAVRHSAVEAMLRSDPDALAHTLLEVCADLSNIMVLRGLEPVMPRFRERLETPLMVALSSPGHPVPNRVAAARLLGGMRSTASAALFADVVKSGTDPALALVCAEALAGLSFSGALPGLIEMTQHDDPRIRWNAARGLGRIGGDRAAQALEAVAGGTTEPNIEVRLAAIESLSVVGRPESVPVLAHAMTLNPVLRNAAGIALRRLTGVTLPEEEPDKWIEWHESGAWKPTAPRGGGDGADGLPPPPVQQPLPSVPAIPPYFQPGADNQGDGS
jgi:hypothetical protein